MNVVIIGGGFCGALLAKELDMEKNIAVTLINKNPYFEYNPSAHKCITDPGYQKNIQVPFDQFLSNTSIITESVKEVTPTGIITESGHIDFDYAVLCVGSYYPVYLSSKQNVYTMSRSDEAKQIFKSLKNAKTVLLVGGGYVGTEIAGELSTKRSDLDIVFVQSHDRLLERNPLSVSTYAEKFLDKRDVQFLFNERVIAHPDENTYKTKSGKLIDADVCIWTTGTKVDTSFLRGFNQDLFEDSGHIKVNESLQLSGYPRLFAGGDITAIKEEKTARKAELHASLIATNLKRIYQKKSLKSYRQGKSPMVISLGDNHGVGQYGRLVITGRLSGIAKWMIEWWTLKRL